MRVSIRTLLIALIIAVMLPSLVIILYSGVERQQTAILNAEIRAVGLVHNAALALERFVEGTRSMLATLSQIPEVHKLDAAGCNRIFKDILGANHLYNSLQASTAQGVLFASAVPLPGIIDITDRKYYQDAVLSKQFAVGEYIIGRTAKKPMVNFGFPVQSPGTEVVAVLQAGYNLERIGGLLDLQGLEKGMHLIVTDHRGTILFHSDNRPDLIGKTDSPGLFSAMKDSGKEEGVYYHQSEGGKELYAYKRLKLTSSSVPFFYVRAGFTQEAFMGESKRILQRNLLLFTAALVLGAYVAILLVRRITKPLSLLVATSSQLSRGNYEINLPEQSIYREISLLNDNFRVMSDAVQSREWHLREQNEALLVAEEELRSLNTELEARVGSRTLELQETNRILQAEIIQRTQAEKDISCLNNDLQLRSNELEHANNELEAFSYSVSHDLRAPLRGVDGFSHALLEEYSDKLDETGKNYINRIRKGCVRMGRLIDDLLKLSRITRSEINRIRVDLSVIAEETIQNLQRMEPDRKVEARIDAGMVANADLTLIRSVLENLLGNAWKFTRNTAQPLIQFSIIKDNGDCIYCIKDNGAGFNMEYAGKLFTAFQRLHRPDEFEGTGVGLASVKRVITMHGGKIWADSEAGNGAAFYFTLGDA